MPPVRQDVFKQEIGQNHPSDDARYALDAEAGSIFLKSSYPTPPAESHDRLDASTNDHNTESADCSTPAAMFDTPCLAYHGPRKALECLLATSPQAKKSLQAMKSSHAPKCPALTFEAQQFDLKILTEQRRTSPVPTTNPLIQSTHRPVSALAGGRVARNSTRSPKVDGSAQSQSCHTQEGNGLAASVCHLDPLQIIDPTFQTHSCNGHPPIWTASSMLSNKEIDLTFGVVLSPTFMVGLPCGGMIELACCYT